MHSVELAVRNFVWSKTKGQKYPIVVRHGIKKGKNNQKHLKGK